VSDASAALQPSAPSRDEIREELEQTRSGYHELLESLSADDLKKKSANEAWSVGQLMYHLAWAYGYIADGVERSRNEKNFNPPNAIADFMNVWITRMGARGMTSEKASAKYDESHEKALSVLETVQGDEWSKGARIFGQFRTVEDQFRSIPEHLIEHRAHILKGLGRA
jgi:hypothetical protein